MVIYIREICEIEGVVGEEIERLIGEEIHILSWILSRKRVFLNFQGSIKINDGKQTTNKETRKILINK